MDHALVAFSLASSGYQSPSGSATGVTCGAVFATGTPFIRMTYFLFCSVTSTADLSRYTVLQLHIDWAQPRLFRGMDVTPAYQTTSSNEELPRLILQGSDFLCLPSLNRYAVSQVPAGLPDDGQG